jgi:alginate O-acetyltransferase complex protein AlgI
VLFNSYLFWIFFGFVALIYWRLGQRAQNRWLLFVSYVFYACWDWRFLGLLGAATLLTYAVAQRIDKAGATPGARRAWLALGLLWNLGSLFFFKYCGWFVESLDALLKLAGQSPTGWVVSIALPVGISFFTFQLVSYLADVYGRNPRPRPIWNASRSMWLSSRSSSPGRSNGRTACSLSLRKRARP